jgi:hypothetical protein
MGMGMGMGVALMMLAADALICIVPVTTFAPCGRIR